MSESEAAPQMAHRMNFASQTLVSVPEAMPETGFRILNQSVNGPSSAVTCAALSMPPKITPCSDCGETL
jgi:hypothetical protein